MEKNLEILADAVARWRDPSRPVASAPTAPELAAELDIQLHDTAADDDAIIQAINHYLDFSPKSSRKEFFKLLYSGVNETALLGDWITSLANATMHTYQVGPVATLMELELIKQWNQLVGFPDGDGVMVSGGSQANVVGMMLARHQINSDIKQTGLVGSPKVLRAYVSDQAHYSYQRAANLLGIGTENLVAVKSTPQGQLCPQHLDAAIEHDIQKGHLPFFVGLTAGTTVIGAYDDVAQCSQVAKRFNCWLHIDGAWGAPVLFSDRHKHLLANSELADSFAWDAHKLMNVPITAAVILVKKAGLLQASSAGGGGEYLFHQDANANFNLGERSIQCGRRADSLKVWLSWKALGNQGFAEKIDQLQKLRENCVAIINDEQKLEMIAPAVYLNVLFRFNPNISLDNEALNQLNVGICKEMMKSGTFYVDYATRNEQVGIRLVLANAECQLNDLKVLIDEICRTGNLLLEG